MAIPLCNNLESSPGLVRCDAVGEEGRFSAVALEMDPATRTFTTLSVFPVPEMPDREIDARQGCSQRVPHCSPYVNKL